MNLTVIGWILITFGTWSGCSLELCCCKQMKIRFFTVIFITSDAFFTDSSVCHIYKLISVAINMLYCSWSLLGWVITHLVSQFGAFSSVLCDGCPLVPMEEEKCIYIYISWPPLIHFTFCKQGSAITRVVYVLEFCYHMLLEWAKLNDSVVELLCWILVTTDCQKLGSVRLRWPSAAKCLLGHQWKIFSWFGS